MGKVGKSSGPCRDDNPASVEEDKEGSTKSCGDDLPGSAYHNGFHDILVFAKSYELWFVSSF